MAGVHLYTPLRPTHCAHMHAGRARLVLLLCIEPVLAAQFHRRHVEVYDDGDDDDVDDDAEELNSPVLPPQGRFAMAMQRQW